VLKASDRTNRILTSAQRSIEETGSASASEIRRVKRAVDLTTGAVIEANKPKLDPDGNKAAFSRINTAVLSDAFNTSYGGVDRDSEGVVEKLGFVDPSQLQKDEITALRVALESGIEVEVAGAIGDISRSESLSGTPQGAQFVKIVDMLGSLMQEGVSSNLSTKAVEDMQKLLGEVAKTLDPAKTALRLKGEGFSSLVKPMATAEEGITEARQAQQNQVRATGVEAFEEAILGLEGVFKSGAELLDVDTLDLAVRLSTKDLGVETKRLEALTNSLNKQLDNSLDVNFIKTEDRANLINKLMSDIETFGDNLKI